MMSTTQMKEPLVTAAKPGGVQPLRWFFFTVLFSYVPLGAKLIFSLLFSVKTGASGCIGEIMFAAIVVSAETLHIMYEGRARRKAGGLVEGFWLFVLFSSILVIIIAAMVYGAMLITEITNPQVAWGIAVGFSVGTFALGLPPQILARKGE